MGQGRGSLDSPPSMPDLGWAQCRTKGGLRDLLKGGWLGVLGKVVCALVLLGRRWGGENKRRKFGGTLMLRRALAGWR